MDGGDEEAALRGLGLGGQADDGRMASSGRREVAARVAAAWGVSIVMDATLTNLAVDSEMEGNSGDDGEDGDVG